MGELGRCWGVRPVRGTAAIVARFVAAGRESAPVLEVLLRSRIIRGRPVDDVDLGVCGSLPSSSSSEKKVPFKGEKCRELLTALRLPAGADPSSSAAVE